LSQNIHAYALTMSPFSTYLRTLRRARGLRQVELAHLLGYEASYTTGKMPQ
jgi:transcriptional regulator with XRE-family HTH domain